MSPKPKGEPKLGSPEQALPVDEYDVRTGLLEFYASQADMVLTQYNNINHLLGPTDDWTAPGTYCEILLRDLLRRSFPAHLSIDKGFIHGRRKVGDKWIHSPEIDILVHDSHNFRPVFRMDDFVIVQPEAVRAVIQVKRTMTSGVLEKALENVVEAKRHVRDCGRASVELSRVFSAVVTFEDDIKDRKDGGLSETYGNRLRACYTEEKDAHTLPNFVGSLSKLFFGKNVRPDRVSYGVWPSIHDKKNVGLQVLLASMTQTIIEQGFYPRFGFPAGMSLAGTIVIFEKPRAKSAPAGEEPKPPAS